MPTITFIRHAETEFNTQERFTGRIDCNITKKGEEEAKKLLREEDKNFDYIYCSSLKRTQQTLNAIIPNSVPIIDDRIIENGLGEWEGKQKTTIDQELIKLFKQGKFTPKGAEKREDIDKRVCDFVENMFSKYKENERILVITHGGIIINIKRNFKSQLENKMTNNLEVLTITEEDFKYYKNESLK